MECGVFFNSICVSVFSGTVSMKRPGPGGDLDLMHVNLAETAAEGHYVRGYTRRTGPRVGHQ